MKKDRLKLLLILVLNLILSFLFNVTNNFFTIFFIDLIFWTCLFIPYYYLNDKKNSCYYWFYYFINLSLLNILFVIFGFDFIKIKIINIFIISFLIFCKFNVDRVRKFNIYLFLFNVVFLFLLSSSMVPIGQRNSNTDYSVFRYIGLLLHNGKVPYRDVFDHKGLLLYFINYLGILIHKEIGIWIIELLFMYLSIVLIYKITLLFSKKMNLISTLVIFSAFILTYYGAGNFVEQYAVFFILFGMYLFCKDIKEKNKVDLKSSFLIGVTLGAVLMLRPNMIAVYICMAFYLLFVYLKKKEIKELIKLICLFLLGIIFFVLPNIIYLVVNDAFEDFVFQYLTFNFMYSFADGGNSFFDVVVFFFKYCRLTVICICIIIFFLFKKKYDRNMLLLFLWMIILSFLLVIISGNTYSHYAIVMIPTFIYPIIVFFEYLYDYLCDFFVGDIFVKIIIISFSFLFLLNDFFVLIKEINNKLYGNNNYENIEKIIIRESESDDNVLVYGNAVNIYLKTNRFTESKYPYQLPIIVVSDKVKNDFKKQINDNLPELIVVDVYNKESFLECCGDILNNYIMCYSDLEYIVYKLYK